VGEWAHNHFPRIIGEEWEWYPLQNPHSVSCHLTEIQQPAPQGPPALQSALEPILVAKNPGVTESVNSVIDKKKNGTEFKLINLLHMEHANLTPHYVNSNIHKVETCWNIHLGSYDIVISSAKLSSNKQLSYWACSFWMVDESYQYMSRISERWSIVLQARIRFQLQIAARSGLY
jgi:hypothetical protein